MTLDLLVVWIIIGAITGILLDSVFGGTGAGITGAILVGIVGAITGAWIFSLLEIRILPGLIGVVMQALIGAVVLLSCLRLVRRT